MSSRMSRDVNETNDSTLCVTDSPWLSRLQIAVPRILRRAPERFSIATLLPCSSTSTSAPRAKSLRQSAEWYASARFFLAGARRLNDSRHQRFGRSTADSGSIHRHRPSSGAYLFPGQATLVFGRTLASISPTQSHSTWGNFCLPPSRRLRAYTPFSDKSAVVPIHGGKKKMSSSCGRKSVSKFSNLDSTVSPCPRKPAPAPQKIRSLIAAANEQLRCAFFPLVDSQSTRADLDVLHNLKYGEDYSILSLSQVT